MMQKPCVLSIQRTDGTLTWSKLYRGLETHDLAHYAVEFTLGFKLAFYGIIDKGYAISDFAIPKDQRPDAVKPENLAPEALITEYIVNLLETEHLNSGFNATFIEDLKIILKDNNLAFPVKLNTEALTNIRSVYHDLVNKWIGLNENEELNIIFTN